MRDKLKYCEAWRFYDQLLKLAPIDAGSAVGREWPTPSKDKRSISVNIDDLRREAAFYTVDNHVSDGMCLGLGTDPTIIYVIDRLRDNLARGRLHDLATVATSSYIADAVQHNDIPLVTLDQVSSLDLYLGGAEEVDADLSHIIGMMGSPFLEKMVAAASRDVTIIATENALVDRLGTRAPLPVEVLPFGWSNHKIWLASLGFRPTLRHKQDGAPFTTDIGNYIYDCSLPEDAYSGLSQLEWDLGKRLGTVASGFFKYGWEHRMYRVVVATKNNGVQDRYLEPD